MVRRRFTSIAALAALAVALVGLVPSYAAADGELPFYVTVTGYQMYSTTNVSFFGDSDNSSDVYTSSSPHCTRLANGDPIDPSLDVGTYTIDGDSCTGMRLLGDRASEYRIVFIGSTFRVNRVTVAATASATSVTEALKTGKVIYTVKVRADYTLAPAPGVPVKIWLLPGSGTKALQCTAVTGPDGVAQCSASVLPLVLSLGFKFYYGTEQTSHYYSAGGSASAPLT